MKKITLRTIVTAILATVTIGLYAQPKIFSKKEDLKDINSKTLMVVLEGNTLTDLALKEAVTNCWNLSAAEFCNYDNFKELRCDTSYYFLVRVKGEFKKEDDATTEFISLLKGGKEGESGVEEMYDVLTLPFGSSEDDNSTIVPYLESYIKIFRTHVERVQKKKIAATIGISWYSNRLSEIGKRELLFNEAHLAEDAKDVEIEKMFKGHARLVDEETITTAIELSSPETLISLCIAPEEPQNGASYCYKMLIGADNGELYYYRKQKITDKNPKGFLKEDLKKISIPFIF